MTKRKFKGKVHADPETALARGPREVMAALWEEYLAVILGVSPESRRFQKLSADVHKAAGFPDIFQSWNDLEAPARAAAWHRLLAAAREVHFASQESCIRCGECCELSSPTLLAPDLALFQHEALTWNDVYTLRAGETVTSRQGEVTTLEGERLKVREVPGSRQCWFYLAATGSCRIYEQRPEQCRRQNCWGEPAPEPGAADLLTRRDLFTRVPELWELIEAHQERCELAKLSRALYALAAGDENAGDLVFDALHFDHYLRELFLKDWGLPPAAVELLLGRPLPEFLRTRGLKATLTPEGGFRLEPLPEKG